jgi:hypothetical protein
MLPARLTTRPALAHATRRVVRLAPVRAGRRGEAAA